jgi:hypothetical protein
MLTSIKVITQIRKKAKNEQKFFFLSRIDLLLFRYYTIFSKEEKKIFLIKKYKLKQIVLLKNIMELKWQL